MGAVSRLAKETGIPLPRLRAMITMAAFESAWGDDARLAMLERILAAEARTAIADGGT